MSNPSSKAYRISNPATGISLGTYSGAEPADALDAMARDAGYASYVACCLDVPAPDGGLRVTETTEDQLLIEGDH